MGFHFQRLFGVELGHDVLEAGVFSGLELEPTRETAELMRRKALLFKGLPSGFQVFYQAIREAGDRMKPREIDTSDVYRFMLFARDAGFLHYTDLPIKHSEPGLFHLHNHHANVDGEGRPLLSNPVGGAKQVGAADRIKLKKTPPSNGAEASGFIPDQEIFRRKPLAVIDISTTAELPLTSRLVDADGAPSPKTYRVQFGVRSTTWRYHVILKYSTKLKADALSIIPGPNGPGFGPGSEEASVDGDRSILFESTEAIPMLAKTTPLALKDGPEKEIVSRLPNPKTVSAERTETAEKYFSDTYLYI